MEDQLKIISRNREFMLLVLNLAESVNQLVLSIDGTSKRCSEPVVDAVLAILDTADKYGDEALQNSLGQLKHKLKVGIAELRTCCEKKLQLLFVRHQAVPQGIELLACLEEFELATLAEAHDVAIQSMKELEFLYGGQDSHVRSGIIAVFKDVLPFLKKAQQRVTSLPQRCMFEGFVDAAAVQKFYLHFLADVSVLLTDYPSSRHVKTLWDFAIRQTCIWLSKLRDLACSVSSCDFLDRWMGVFVNNMEEALYHLAHKSGDDYSAAVTDVTSHGLTLGQLLPEDDRKKLMYAYAQIVQCKTDLENAEGDKEWAEQERQKLKAALENFEEFVNIALVKVIVQDYMTPISSFARLLDAAKQDLLKKECSNSTPDLSLAYKSETAAFCASVDNTYCIAHLAAGCTTDVRSVSKLWDHLRLMEWLDPELVATVMSLVSGRDKGLLDVLKMIQYAWNFHVHGLFKSLLRLTEPTAFFVCLDASLKSSITSLADSSIDDRTSAGVVSEICIRTSSVLELTKVVFEGNTVPEKVMIALRNLMIARQSLKKAAPPNRLKGAKVVRGCVKVVHEEIDRHLDVVSETPSHFPSRLLTGLTTLAASRNPTTTVEISLDLEITALLEALEPAGMEQTRMLCSVKPSTTKDSSLEASGVAEKECAVSKLLEQHAEMRTVSVSRVKTWLDTSAEPASRDTLSRSLWRSERSLCAGTENFRSWLQNNSTIYTLTHEAQLLAKAVIDAQEELCSPDSLGHLAGIGHKLAEEVASVCTRLVGVKSRGRLVADVERSRGEIEFIARQMRLFSDLAKDGTVTNKGIAPLAENLLLLVSEVLKTLPMLCAQCHDGTEVNSLAKIALLRCDEKSSPGTAGNASSTSA
ncbi:hypothetical protein V5799_018247 [Amblyomma americanum]|uniref:Uncharacterized protein n=1 Tax=Amblyomma americanum TaxID=6943 RepID=A0AAQ4F0W9_AMBAM